MVIWNTNMAQGHCELCKQDLPATCASVGVVWLMGGQLMYKS